MIAALRTYYSNVAHALMGAPQTQARMGQAMVPQPHLTLVQDQSQPLEYHPTQKAMLVMEQDAQGNEYPIAIAFRHKNSEMFIAYFDQLAEVDADEMSS